ncbi:large conductance mechanosensitive channel protein MscL [Agromyces sp. LHK192]|uniref:large conductance mechanosensitive channel protein MscL n=1 Tax=Agromyces sp. LHK192 TaxID=2498704 RepID=UPI000FDC7006|nr:large conductance mechanosensitive channel protein MscL [Agromyces sp. LHK192]
MLKGFKEFILRGNVIELAVAVVIGAAFTAVVNALVVNLINPLIGAVFRADSLDNALVVEIPTLDGEPAQLKFGAVIGAILTFVIVAAVVYFVFVLPMNTLKERAEAKRRVGQPDPGQPETELTVLAEIRDLLARGDRLPSGAASDAGGGTPDASPSADAEPRQGSGRHAG